MGMKTITKQKPWEEILESLSRAEKVYVIGCGTCATMCHTGGKAEVLEMKIRLEETNKEVTGWMVIPTACDELTKYALEDNAEAISEADAILALTCAFGVQTASLYTTKAVYPGLNTLFVGLEEVPGHFVEVCQQCGDCLLAKTAGICPLVRCAKSLLNGPCGGSADGKCEISPDTPCAWQMIIDRLQAQNRLDVLEEIVPPRDWSTSSSGGPRKIIIES
jgi:ferredoxin